MSHQRIRLWRTSLPSLIYARLLLPDPGCSQPPIPRPIASHDDTQAGSTAASENVRLFHTSTLDTYSPCPSYVHPGGPGCSSYLALDQLNIYLADPIANRLTLHQQLDQPFDQARHSVITDHPRPSFVVRHPPGPHRV